MTSQLDVSLHHRSLELATPLVTGSGTISSRDIVLVRVENAAGLVGWGEAAPLPGWPGPDLAATTASLAEWIDGGLLQAPTTGPACAAVQCSLLDIAAQEAGLSLAQCLNPDAAQTVAVNTLIDALDPETVERLAFDAAEAGFRTIKVKVATSPHDVDRVRAARRGAPDARLRLDANRGLTHDEAVHFCRAVEPLDIEFVEEPVLGGVDALRALQSEVGIAIAADESLAEINVAHIEDLGIATLVVKPSALGHLETLYRLADHHRVVVTSFLDSAVGVTMGLHLAAAMAPLQADHAMACGLATSSRFVADIAAAPSFSDGTLAVPSLPGLGVTPSANTP